MKNARLLAWLCPVLCVFLVPTFVFAEGWGMPNLNPFASKSKSSSNSWFPSGKKTNSSFASRTTKQPSTWQKMSKSTANAWNKTTSAMNPWKEEKKVSTKITGARRPASAPKTASKSTWYNPTSWFAKEEQAPVGNRPAESVSEFLNQPRVPY